MLIGKYDKYLTDKKLKLNLLSELKFKMKLNHISVPGTSEIPKWIMANLMCQYSQFF